MTAALTLVGDTLESFARRGVFKGFSRGTARGQRGSFTVVWHRQQAFEWDYDGARQLLRIDTVLPAVPPRSSMDREFRAWLRARQDVSLPAHRLCDPAKLELSVRNRAGNVSLAAKLLDDDVEYAVKKLVALLNEVYLDFLSSGLYFDWLIETFDLDPDNPY